MGTSPQALVPLVCQAVASPHTRRTYSRALREFLEHSDGQSPLSRETVLAHLSRMRAAERSPATMNQHLTAIKLLAREARERGCLDHTTTESILSVRGVRQLGVRTGRWLSRIDAQRLINAPEDGTPQGLRDRALLAILVGCGLRRAEAAAVQIEQLQQRENRWLLVDLVGKGMRVRTVPVPGWAYRRISAWLDAAAIVEGPILRPVNKGGRSNGRGMTDAGVWWVVRKYARELDLDVAPHNLRRTFATLASKGGAPTRQIQKALGHSSEATTERYLGDGLDLENAACDYTGLVEG